MITSMSAPEILAITLPTLSVSVGILLNRNDVARLDTRINSLQTQMIADFSALRGEMNKMREQIGIARDDLRSEIGSVRDNLRREIGVVRNDQREFYHTLGQHETRLDNLEKN